MTKEELEILKSINNNQKESLELQVEFIEYLQRLLACLAIFLGFMIVLMVLSVFI